MIRLFTIAGLILFLITGMSLTGCGESNSSAETDNLQTTEASDKAVDNNEALLLLRKAAEACGGIENFKKIKSISAKGKLRFFVPGGTGRGEVEAYESFPNRYAEILITEQGRFTSVFDGTEGWIIEDGTATAMAADILEDSRRDRVRSLINVFAGLDNPENFWLDYQGKVDFHDDNRHRIDCTTLDAGAYMLFLDTATFIPVGIKYLVSAGEGHADRMVILFKDWRQLGDVRIPGEIRRAKDLTKVILKFEDIRINEDFDESVFDKPDVVLPAPAPQPQTEAPEASTEDAP